MSTRKNIGIEHRETKWQAKISVGQEYYNPPAYCDHYNKKGPSRIPRSDHNSRLSTSKFGKDSNYNNAGQSPNNE